MTKKTTYAIVDLETTGTAINGTNRIIQFSCVFVQYGKIVNEFSTLVDPRQPIPPEISQLTKISDRDVRKAPTFEEVAGTIYALLQNTIFVAHNISFDYNFLNNELIRVGYPEIGGRGIDTVQLTQVVLPTLPSYRLSDISRFLGLTHEKPHNAASDAKTTAALFLKLQEKIANFPVTLLQQLSNLGDQMYFDTVDCFKLAYQKKRQQETKLPANQMSVGGIILRRPNFTKDTLTALEYPASAAEKKKLFTDVIDWRPEQVNMMDDVFSFFNADPDLLRVLDAPTGTGKTLGYLFPAAYLTRQGKQVVISTATTALQTQLQDHSFALLKELLPFSCSLVSLKGNHHFIDLDRFDRSLKQPQNAHTRLLQMRILVWLMQTKTGDFDELHLTKLQDPLFADIRHHGVNGLDQDSRFYSVDFLRRKRAVEENADFVLTNHAYLSTHVDELADKDSLLIVDEAQHLPQMTRKSNKRVVDLDEIKILADSILVKIQSHEAYSFLNLIEDGFITSSTVKNLLEVIRVIDTKAPQLRTEFARAFIKKSAQHGDYFESIVPLKKFRGFIKAHLEEFVSIANAYQKLLQMNRRIYQSYVAQSVSLHLSSNANQLLGDYFTLADSLNKVLKNWVIFSLSRLEEEGDSQVTWLSRSSVAGAHLRVNNGLMKTEGFLYDRIYSGFQHVLLTGAGLAVTQLKQYIKKELDLTNNTKITVYKSPFDYHKQVKAMVASDAPDVGLVDYQEYCEYLAEMIAAISEEVPKQTLVLFNSLQTISDVYEQLQKKSITFDKNILAQGISGGVEKIKKRFVMDREHKAILLGTGSFFEGIDLPNDNLELLIVTRLPFQPVGSIINQARYSQAEMKGQDPFWTISLPEAVSKLNQGFGRLIRTPNDTGAFVLLDPRFLTKKYGSLFEKSFPAGVDLQNVPSSQIVLALQKFFKNIKTAL